MSLDLGEALLIHIHTTGNETVSNGPTLKRKNGYSLQNDSLQDDIVKDDSLQDKCLQDDNLQETYMC